MKKPIAPDYETAMTTLAVRFYGAPCSKCSNSIRYTRNRACVACVTTKAKAWMKANAGTGEAAPRKAKRQYLKDCYRIVARAARGVPVDDVLRMACVRDLLLALGAVEQPAPSGELGDPWGGL